MARNTLGEARLQRVNVGCVDKNQPVLRCLKCGKGWQPNIKPRGGLYRGWWKCPEGCNAHFKSIDRPEGGR
jgi:hypothetical protein